MDIVFLKFAPFLNTYLNFDPRKNINLNITHAIHPFIEKGEKYDPTKEYKKFKSTILEMKKSKNVDAKGQVPLMNDKLFSELGRDSSIYIPMDFHFETTTTIYYMVTLEDAAIILGGSLSLLEAISETLAPLIVLSFVMKLSQIELDR